MMVILIITMIIILIPLIISLINQFLSLNKNKDREKLTSFECGFNQIMPTNLPFSIQFFLISLMFLIFDIEIILILPIIMNKKYSSYSKSYTFMLFIFILIISLWYEWSFKYLNWI